MPRYLVIEDSRPYNYPHCFVAESTEYDDTYRRRTNNVGPDMAMAIKIALESGRHVDPDLLVSLVDEL